MISMWIGVSSDSDVIGHMFIGDAEGPRVIISR